MDVVWAVAGWGLIVAVVVDVWATVLHPDAEGVVAKAVRRGVWRLATEVGTRFPAVRRRALVLAGPVLVAVTFVLWVALLMLGVGLAVWSMIDQYTAVPELGELTFLDALYYAGNVVAVLGFGDITPLSGPGKVLAVVASGTGFALLSGITAYLIEVVGGLSARDRLTLAVHDDTRDGGGVAMVADCLVEEGPEELRQRCRTWAEHLRAVDEIVHRYPLVVFTYRSHRTEYDPEPALRHAAEAVVAVLVLAAEPGVERGLRTTAYALELALTRLQRTIADKYLPTRVRRVLADPAPTATDRQAVARVAAMLTDRLGEADPPAAGESAHDRAAEVVFCSRVFFEGLRRWARAEAYRLEWDADLAQSRSASRDSG